MGGLVVETVRPGVTFIPDAAAAFRRADAQVWAEFGRGIDVNSTYRSWADQMLMFENWGRYVAGKGPYPGHSKAVHPSESFHVAGTALDSDDWRNARIVQILAENGFIRNRLYVKGEDHHFEWLRSRDTRYGTPIPAGANSAPANTSKEDEMQEPDSMFAVVDGVPSWCWLNWGQGTIYAVHTQAEATWIGGYMGSIKRDFREAIVNGQKVTDGGGDLYKNKLALFGIMCPSVKIKGASLTEADLARIKALVDAGVKGAVSGA